MLQANLDQLKRVYNYVFPKFAGDQGLKNAMELVCRLSDLNLTEKEAKFCYGMSKMTVRDEVPNHHEYQKLRFVEFLEFIGRLAHSKYSDEAGLELAEKIERVLDLIFPVYNLKRIDVDGDLANDETSEESCIIDADEI